MPNPIATIAIRNPRVLEILDEELKHRVGRNATEVAENMIQADAERRRIARSRSLDHIQKKHRPAKAIA